MSADPVPQTVSDVIDRRNESRKYMQQNYWDEFESVYRSSKCLAPKIMTTDAQGNEVEDKSRTNVCFPVTSLSIRRSVARLTANHPQINYTSPQGNEDVEQKLTAWAFQQFDKSGEVQQHRRLVHTGETFGWSVSKLSWDKITVDRSFRKYFVGRDGETVDFKDRADYMRSQGAPDDEIDDAVKQNGPDLNDQELSQAIAENGNSVQVPSQLTKYEGPILRNVFIGDIFIEPGCLSLDESAWVTENYAEGVQFLKKWMGQTYTDPETGKETPVFDKRACQDLIDLGTWSPNQGTQQPYDLKTRFRTAVLNQQVPLYPTNLLPGKRFDIIEQHAKDSTGQMWITWVGNEKVLLGRMPYPWEFYGKYCYTEYVPLFDLISAIGDSVPRLHRFLQSLLNVTAGQRKDLIRHLLKPIILQRAGEDVPDEQIERAFYRLITCKDPRSFQPFMGENGGALAAAFKGALEEEGQIMRHWQLSDPSVGNTESGTDADPQAGKTATTAVLAQKASDALTQFKLDSLSYYLKETGLKKLWMLQQQERDVNQGYDIEQKYVNKVEALASRFGGQTQKVCLYPDELQEDFGVEPEAMSMLSADDDIRRQAGLQLLQMAAQLPGVVDPVYAARFFAGTIRGVDPQQAVPDPQPPPPVPPKSNIAIAVKWAELPSELQLQLAQGMGAQPTPELQQELQLQDTMKGLQMANQGADAASQLLGPDPGDQQQAQAQQEQQNTANEQANSQVNAAADRTLKQQELKIKDKIASKPPAKSKPN